MQPQGAALSESVVDELAALTARMYASDDLEETLRRVTTVATHAVGGCAAASLSLLEPDGPVTRAATAELAGAGDRIQYEAGGGPCLDAAMAERWVYTPDLRRDLRWPRSSGRLADELGVGSMVSCRLTVEAAPQRTLGGLNLYATAPDAFGEDDRLVAVLLAAVAALSIHAAREQAGLRTAIASRQVIGEAVGMLRGRHDVSSDAAFRMLVEASQRANVKVRDLAWRMTRDTEPPAD